MVHHPKILMAAVFILLMPFMGVAQSYKGNQSKNQDYITQKDLWYFEQNTSQESMRKFLNEFGWYSKAGQYWIGGDPNRLGIGLRYKKTNRNTDLFADQNGNVLSIMWHNHEGLDIEARHHYLGIYMEDKYRKKWPNCEIIKLTTKPFRINGNLAIRTVFDVKAMQSEMLLRVYAITVKATQKYYTLVLVYQHEIMGDTESGDEDYWDGLFGRFMKNLQFSFLPVDEEGNIPWY